jgi:hypothetical protein
MWYCSCVIFLIFKRSYDLYCLYLLILHLVLSMLALCSFLLCVFLYKTMFCIRWAQLDKGVVLLTSYTKDSGNAIPPVCHCDHNKRNAAAILWNITIQHLICYTHCDGFENVIIMTNRINHVLYNCGSKTMVRVSYMAKWFKWTKSFNLLSICEKVRLELHRVLPI